MKERIKSLFLILLIANALVLSLGMWKDKNINYGEEVPKSTSFFDVIKPERTIVNYSPTIILNYSDFKPPLYEISKDLIKTSLSQEKVTELKERPEGRFVEFCFSNPINTYLMCENFDVRNNQLAEKIGDIECISIYFDIEKENVITIFGNSINHFSVKIDKNKAFKLMEALKVLEDKKNFDYYYNAKNDLDLDRDIYFPYEINRTIPAFILRNEIKEMDISERRNFAESFLNESRGTLQEIIREDGTSLYISGNEVLTLYPSGILNYFNPLQGKVKNSNLPECVNSAVSFLESRIDSMRNYYLSKIEEIQTDGNFGYKLYFDYRINGIPVRYRNSRGITVEVYKNHIRNVDYIMRRESRMLLGEDEKLLKIKSSFDILENQFEVFERNYSKYFNKDKPEVNEVMKSISKITLSYYDAMFKEKDSTITPVWLYHTEFGILGFDAAAGNLVVKDLVN